MRVLSREGRADCTVTITKMQDTGQHNHSSGVPHPALIAVTSIFNQQAVKDM